MLLWRLETHGAHVVQSVGELDDDDADILRHGDEHLAIAFKLSLFFGMALDLVELGDAFNKKGDFLVEFALEIEAGAVGVFDDVVQKPGGDGVVIEPEIGQDDGDVYWVDDVRFTGFAILAFVHFAGKFVGFLDHDAVCLWVIFQNDLDEVVVSNLMAHGFTSLPCQVRRAERAANDMLQRVDVFRKGDLLKLGQRPGFARSFQKCRRFGGARDAHDLFRL